ncbi:MAG: TGS domain-containing protein [Nanoarchaeota archaeon]|nr:TGS domain-containing protein [Nanoarchaeota archaeon]
MASTNQSPAYQRAHGRFLAAQTDEEKLEALEEMIRECPKHKSSENMLANLKTRYKKLKAQIAKSKKSKKGQAGIKKSDMQAVIVGLTNSGKSSLISLFTNIHPEIASYNFTTKSPVVGMMNYAGTQIQLIEIPAIESEYYDKGVVHTADVLLIMINNLKDIEKIIPKLHSPARKIIVFNNLDKSKEELRKIDATLKSRRYNYIIINTKIQEGIEELKKRTFQSFDNIRIYTKEPGKPKSPKPIILKPGATVKDFARKIHEKFIKQFKFAKVWGPSAKFGGMVCGLKHVLKDKDIIELHTS